eukprot:3448817-Rhodomonas_salina.3
MFPINCVPSVDSAFPSINSEAFAWNEEQCSQAGHSIPLSCSQSEPELFASLESGQSESFSSLASSEQHQHGPFTGLSSELLLTRLESHSDFSELSSDSWGVAEETKAFSEHIAMTDLRNKYCQDDCSSRSSESDEGRSHRTTPTESSNELSSNEASENAAVKRGRGRPRGVKDSKPRRKKVLKHFVARSFGAQLVRGESEGGHHPRK